jgi:hypothetical protein
MVAIVSELFLLQYMLYELDIAEFIIVFFTSFDILEMLQALTNFLISEIKPNVDTSIVNNESRNCDASAVRICAMFAYLFVLKFLDFSRFVS